METITLTLRDDRTGTVSGYLGGLTTEIYRIEGREVPDGTRLALLTPEGLTLASSEIEVGDDGAQAEVATDTQEVADLLRYQPVGAEASVHIAIGDEDNILAIIPAKMRKNWLDDSAVHPPAPLPDYWTSEQVKTAIAEALKGYATEEWVSQKLKGYAAMTSSCGVNAAVEGNGISFGVGVFGDDSANVWAQTDDGYAEAALATKGYVDRLAQASAIQHLDEYGNGLAVNQLVGGCAYEFLAGHGLYDACPSTAFAVTGEGEIGVFINYQFYPFTSDVFCSSGGALPSSILVFNGDPATVDAEAQKYVVMGAGASGSQCSVVVGYGGVATDGGVSLGDDAEAGYDAVASGRGASAGGNNAVAIGHIANAQTSGVAVGYNAYSQTEGVAVGSDARATQCAIAIGQSARASSGSGVAIGHGPDALGLHSVAIGYHARACQYSVALGYRAEAGWGIYGKSVAIGHDAAAFGRAIAIGTETSVYSQGYGNLALGDRAFVGGGTDYENAAIGYGAIVDGVCTYRAAVFGARGYTNISSGTVLSASDISQTLTLQLYLVACRELCKYGVIGLTMTDWLTGETCGVYTGADAFMRALNGTPWTGAFGGGCCSCAA